MTNSTFKVLDYLNSNFDSSQYTFAQVDNLSHFNLHCHIPLGKVHPVVYSFLNPEDYEVMTDRVRSADYIVDVYGESCMIWLLDI